MVYDLQITADDVIFWGLAFLKLRRFVTIQQTGNYYVNGKK